MGCTFIGKFLKLGILCPDLQFQKDLFDGLEWKQMLDWDWIIETSGKRCRFAIK